MLHVNINKSHVNIITLHFNMNYLARMGQRVGFADIGVGGFVTISGVMNLSQSPGVVTWFPSV